MKTQAEEDISTRVRQYLFMKRPEYRKIHMEANGGEVRLLGVVPSFYLRQLAIANASRVTGTLPIFDLLRVLGEELAPPKLGRTAK